MRILHVLGKLDRGGAETWLVQVLRHIDRKKYQMDFLVHTKAPGAYDDEVKALGSRVIPCLRPSSPFQYAYDFLRILRDTAPYDVLHSHVHSFSGIVLTVGRVAKIPMRISHSHTDRSRLAMTEGLGRRSYLGLTKWLIERNCTSGLAASQSAAIDLYGHRWKQKQNVMLAYCGIDVKPFKDRVDGAEVRRGLGISPASVVFGHVGRFDLYKNQKFLVAVAMELTKREPEARFLFVGDGPLKKDIQTRFCNAGIGDRTIFLGSRADVPRLLLGAMDAFLFPSVHEGLGLSLVEAQAAGLPSTVSDSVPNEADVVPSLISRLSLLQPPAVWAETALQGLRGKSTDAFEALKMVEQSPFNIEASAKRLVHIYSS